MNHANGARRRPAECGITRQVSPARKFVFIPPPDTDKNSILWRAGETEILAGADHFMITTAGYLYSAWRISSPDPSIRPRKT